MRFAELLLRCLVRRRDRDAISGDLREEYVEEIRPGRGAVGARVWYVRQVVSFLSPTAWGLLFGVALNAWVLLNTATAPLAEDSGFEMPLALAGVLGVAACVSVRDARDRGTRAAILSGITFGVAFAVVGWLAALLRVNLFLDAISARSDWTGLVARFHASGYSSLRAYANYEYASGAPILIAMGAVAGALGGALATVVRHPRVTAVR
jgi:hypothetical protein